MPTVLHLMSLPVPPDLQGIDLVPLLEKKPGAKAHDVVFSEYLENEEAMVRSDRYKLIVCTGRRLREDGYRTAEPWRLPGPYVRLYDVVADPDETTDLSQDPAHASIKEDLLGADVRADDDDARGARADSSRAFSPRGDSLVPGSARPAGALPAKDLVGPPAPSEQKTSVIGSLNSRRKDERCTNTTRAASG